MNPHTLLLQQKRFFDKRISSDLAWRKIALRRLIGACQAHEEDILAALQADIGKSATEGRLTETSIVAQEGRDLLRNLEDYADGSHLLLEPKLLPGHGEIRPEPYGVVLIISPWNYPFQLTMIPLLAAIAAGNTAIVKPSRATPKTSEVIGTIVEEALPKYWAAVLNDTDGNDLLDLDVDFIFFTGSVSTGKKVQMKAAERLIPTLLELGGKSPVFVTEHADLALSARRIAFGKLMNAGQTCIAPDYVLADRRIAPAFIAELRRAFSDMLPEGAQSEHYPRIIKDKSMERLSKMLEDAPIVSGGQWYGDKLEPTILFPADPNDPVMQEEIFGPILPVLPYHSLKNAVRFVNSRPKPLAAYFFSNDRAELNRLVELVPSGGACLNDTLMHVASGKLPFGGIGESGQGSYHGKASLRALSHEKSIFHQHPKIDIPLRYPPYGPVKRFLIKHLI